MKITISNKTRPNQKENQFNNYLYDNMDEFLKYFMGKNHKDDLLFKGAPILHIDGECYFNQLPDLSGAYNKLPIIIETGLSEKVEKVQSHASKVMQYMQMLKASGNKKGTVVWISPRFDNFLINSLKVIGDEFDIILLKVKELSESNNQRVFELNRYHPKKETLNFELLNSVLDGSYLSKIDDNPKRRYQPITNHSFTSKDIENEMMVTKSFIEKDLGRTRGISIFNKIVDQYYDEGCIVYKVKKSKLNGYNDVECIDMKYYEKLKNKIIDDERTIKENDLISLRELNKLLKPFQVYKNPRRGIAKSALKESSIKTYKLFYLKASYPIENEFIRRVDSLCLIKKLLADKKIKGDSLSFFEKEMSSLAA